MKRIEITLTLEVPENLTPTAVYHNLEGLMTYEIEESGWKIISGSAKEKDV